MDEIGVIVTKRLLGFEVKLVLVANGDAFELALDFFKELAISTMKVLHGFLAIIERLTLGITDDVP